MRASRLLCERPDVYYTLKAAGFLYVPQDLELKIQSTNNFIPVHMGGYPQPVLNYPADYTMPQAPAGYVQTPPAADRYAVDPGYFPGAVPPPVPAEQQPPEFSQYTQEIQAMPEQVLRETKEESKLPKKIAKIAANFTFYTFCLSIVIGAVLFAFSNNPTKAVFGFRFYNVLTESMTPSEGSPPGGFYAGDMIIVSITDPEDIQVGDVITFVPGKESTAYLTHRVIEIRPESGEGLGLTFVTQGDANNTADPPIPASMVIGKRTMTIPKMGYALEFVRGNLLLTVGLVLSIFGLVFAFRQYARLARKEKTAEQERIRS